MGISGHHASRAHPWHDSLPHADDRLVVSTADGPIELCTDHVHFPVVLHHTERAGQAIAAGCDIGVGEIVVVFGGLATPGPRFRMLPAYIQSHSFQVGFDLFLVGAGQPSPGEYINHSCDPNLVLVSDITLAARRDIRSGELLTYDYATSDSVPYDEFECECGSALCRGKVTGEDWLRPELQERYRGSFAPYLQRRIDALSLGEPGPGS